MTSIRSIGLNFRNDPTLQNARSLSRRASRFASAKSTSRRSRLLDSEKQNVAKKVLPFIVSTRSRHQVSVNSKHGSGIGGKTGIFQVPLTVSDVHLRHEQLPFAYFFRETLDAVSLKDSLCRVLEHFPVVSGRIRSQNFQEIECNPLVDSVPLAFGDMDTTLDTWLSESRGHSHISGKGHPELLPIFDPLFEAKRSGGSNELENDSHRIRIPFPYDNLLRIRVTYFQCGGTAIGVNFLHALGDTASCVRFVQCWGREMQRMHYPRGASNARAGACVSGMMTKDLADLMGLLQDLAIADEKDQTSLSWMGLIADLFVSEKSPIESSLTSLETAKSYVYDEGNQHEYLQLRFTPEVLDAMREVALIAIARNERLSGKPEEMHRSFVSTNDLVTAFGWLLKRSLSGNDTFNISMVVNMRGHFGVDLFTDINDGSSDESSISLGVSSPGSVGVFGNGITNIVAVHAATKTSFDVWDVASAAMSIRSALIVGVSELEDRLYHSRRGKASPGMSSTGSFPTTSWGKFPLGDISFASSSPLLAFHGHPSHPLPKGRSTYASVVSRTLETGMDPYGMTYDLLLPSIEVDQAKKKHKDICNAFIAAQSQFRLRKILER